MNHHEAVNPGPSPGPPAPLSSPGLNVETFVILERVTPHRWQQAVASSDGLRACAALLIGLQGSSCVHRFRR
jgi:hypothetical protein